ncbi:MAG: AraC family transcriptional regulator [Phycisphaeraceae bacterium]|nr:AraC family transcriptional regulator [Phycisphaeraceae bacterium]
MNTGQFEGSARGDIVATLARGVEPSSQPESDDPVLGAAASPDLAADPAESWALPRISRAARWGLEPSRTEREQVSGEAEILHVLRGRVIVSGEDYQIVGRAGDTIFAPAGEPHRTIFASRSSFDLFVFQFQWESQGQLLGRYTPAQLARLSGPARAAVADDCQKVYEDFSVGLPYHRSLARLRLMQIIYQMAREAAMAEAGATAAPARANPCRGHSLMTRAKQLIHERFDQALSLEDLAKSLEVSPFYLSRVFRRESGFRLSDYLASVRMERARKLLGEGSKTVQEIAKSVGFADSHYFAKVFKAHFNCSPRDYRARMGERA